MSPRERPIPFSGPMVRAILAGRKTQTRRVVALPRWAEPWTLEECPDGLEAICSKTGCPSSVLCPYGAPGDVLWVRETFALDVPGCERGVSYRADHDDPLGDGPAHPMRWRPSIFLPRWASRITLKVTAVRVERLQAISEEDAVAEGVEPEFEVDLATFVHGPCRALERASTYRLGFKHAWDAINGKRAPWESNPWVWVVSFRRVQS